MPKVKGKPVSNLVAVPHRPWRRRFNGLVFIVICVGVVFLAYHVTQRTQETQFSQLVAQRDDLLASLTSLTTEADRLRKQVAQLESAALVDRQALEGVRQANLDQTDQIAQLEKEVLFYQSIMSPNDANRGLTIHSVTLNPVEDSTHVWFRLMLTQVGNNSNVLNGTASLSVLGVLDGESVRYSLSDLSPTMDSEQFNFRYRYFQAFDTTLILPENFVPDRLEVTAKSSGSRSASVERSYQWTDLEVKNNVGQ